MDQQNTQSQNIPQFSPAPSSGFSEAHYVFLNQLLESATARDFFRQITMTDFSAQCVNAFYKVLTSGFDKNAVLAKNSPSQIQMRILDFDIALNLMVVECHESDIQNPAFLTFKENIKQAFRDFINRSQTERDQLLRQEFGIQPSQPQPQQPSSGNIVQQAAGKIGFGRR